MIVPLLIGLPNILRPPLQSRADLWLLIMISLVAAALLSLLRVRNRQHLDRERRLEIAVDLRTAELRQERTREKRRTQILEMVVANQPLRLVLDAVAHLIAAEIPGASCAILLHKGDRFDIAAAPGVPAAWIEALKTPHAIPFEVRKRACVFESPVTDPAWKIFAGSIKGSPPRAIQARPLGSDEAHLGTILIFGRELGVFRAEVFDHAVKLAEIAIEHGRLYEDLQFQAHHDHLTGLPNRILFEEKLASALGDAREREQRLAVMYIDLDHFKQINDSMSHRIGDLLLRETGNRMRKVLRAHDTVARIGGDEFNILLTNVDSVEEAGVIAQRVLGAIRQPVNVEGHKVSISASAGIAFFPDDETEGENLQRDADAAMYCAKDQGRDRVQVFSSRNESLDRVRMEQELHVALRENRFSVHYQAKICANGEFGGFEALLRLQHPVHGRIPPSQFIPLAEETGLIVQLGAWVLNEVCRQIAEWSAARLGQIPVAVNVSPVQISKPDFAQLVEECLARHRISPRSLELELTESVLIGSSEETQQQMRRLRAIGVTFSIDDFGTGYSSLSYLHRLKVDAIKLDRSFVQSIDTDDAARRLVQAMIGVAQGLGLNVIAEGVETEAQRSALIAAGCPMMQGYLFAHPRPPDELLDYLALLGHPREDVRQIESVVMRPLIPAPTLA